MVAIIQLDTDTYFVKNKGHEMTLIKNGDHWEMSTFNATVAAYRNGFVIPKVFASLEAVERAYSSWRGIVQVHTAFQKWLAEQA